MRVLTYDDFQKGLLYEDYADYVDYSIKNEEKNKTVRRVKRIEKRTNTNNFSYTDFMAGIIFGCMFLVLIVGYGSWVMELMK